MNHEELKYHKALQEVYKEKMGDWQVDDCYYHINSKETGFLDFEDLKSNYLDDFLFHIPLPIDPYNEERGLSGMIGTAFMLWDYCDLYKESLYGFECGIDGKLRSFCGATITLCLLKALAAQEGVEVK